MLLNLQCCLASLDFVEWGWVHFPQIIIHRQQLKRCSWLLLLFEKLFQERKNSGKRSTLDKY